MNEFYWDSFDCQIQCEEFYGDDFNSRKPSPEESLDWMDANLDEDDFFLFEDEFPF